jgi:hypothetical protein
VIMKRSVVVALPALTEISYSFPHALAPALFCDQCPVATAVAVEPFARFWVRERCQKIAQLVWWPAAAFENGEETRVLKKLRQLDCYLWCSSLLTCFTPMYSTPPLFRRRKLIRQAHKMCARYSTVLMVARHGVMRWFDCCGLLY